MSRWFYTRKSLADGVQILLIHMYSTKNSPDVKAWRRLDFCCSLESSLHSSPFRGGACGLLSQTAAGKWAYTQIWLTCIRIGWPNSRICGQCKNIKQNNVFKQVSFTFNICSSIHNITISKTYLYMVHKMRKNMDFFFSFAKVFTRTW